MPEREYKPGYKNSFALIIGINQYRYAAPLAYACNDADAVAKVLMSSLGFPEEHVVLLKDADATKEKILDNYLKFYNRSMPDDRVLIFFAGHGHTLSGSQRKVGFLVPVNGKPDELHTLIRWDDLTKYTYLIEAKHLLFIMDACYSGLAMQRFAAPMGQRFLTNMLQRPARQVMTAGKADEVVADGGGPEGNNSIFTGHLLDALSGKAANEKGILTANGLMHCVYQRWRKIHLRSKLRIMVISTARATLYFSVLALII